MGDAIFPAVLGDTFDALPQPLQELHRGERDSEWVGTASIRGAENLAGRLVAALVGYPAGDREADVRVTIEVTRDGETWTRSIGGKRFRSHLSPGTGREAGLMCERYGMVTVALALTWEEERLWFVPRHWRIGPVPLPKALLPKGDSFEHLREGLFAFDVRVEAPITGLIAAYRGSLRKQPGTR